MDLWFDDVPVLGRLPVQDAAIRLSEVGETEAAQMLLGQTDSSPPGATVVRGPLLSWPFQNRPWQHTSHAFGFIPNADLNATSEFVRILHAGAISPDATLLNSRLKITLNGMRIAEYPGSGSRRVLLDFYAQNQTMGAAEHLHFSATFRVGPNSQVPVLGYPLFIGLKAGPNGICFKCFTVNVANEDDEEFLEFLESDTFRAGMKITSALQPALAPLSSMTYNLVKSIAKRYRNVPVQEFYLGLDFAAGGVGARLAPGTYVAVQMSDTALSMWSWENWLYNRTNGRIISMNNNVSMIPYNYMMFTISLDAS